jgi:hypothetical protein
MVLTSHDNDGRSIITFTSFNPGSHVTFALFFFPLED